MAAAAFLRTRLVALVGKEMLQGGEQERAESSLALIHRVEPVFFQQTMEKLRRQILGVMRTFALAADVGVKRTPI